MARESEHHRVKAAAKVMLNAPPAVRAQPQAALAHQLVFALVMTWMKNIFETVYMYSCGSHTHTLRKGQGQNHTQTLNEEEIQASLDSGQALVEIFNKRA
jgi:hypothetical protein